MSGEIKVDAREVTRALDQVAADVAAMPEAWANVGEAILPAVRQRTPVRSGTLRDSWEATGDAGKASISSAEPYAGVVEAINAPVSGALEASERAILETLEDEIARAAGRIGFEVKR